MNAWQIDFLPRSRPGTLSWAMLAALALALLLVCGHVVYLHRQAEAMTLELAALNEEGRVTQQPVVESLPPPPPYAADAALAQREAEFASAGALTSLEHVAMIGVTPVAIDLQAAGAVTVQVEFTEHAALLAYVDELNVGLERPQWAMVQMRRADKQAIGSATLQSQW